MQKIKPCLWFDGRAEEAIAFYATVFKHTKVKKVSRYGEAGAKVSGMPVGSTMTVDFELDGQELLALNGGPAFRFNEAVSFVVTCKDQEQVDEYWRKLSAGGEELPCGWLRDRYGLCWQVVPKALPEMLQDRDSRKAERVMAAMLEMKKIDVAALKRAYDAAA
jgi:predicted 3-demethylubiquinone-9 3-methyltransferase (glyoxalase superfamily)